MARGLNIEKLIYFFFPTPLHVQTCSVSADYSFATLPLNATADVPFAPSSPVNTMHTILSLLLSFLGLSLLGLVNGSVLLPRQGSDAPFSVYNTRFPNVTWDNDLWRVTTSVLDQGHYQSRQSIANGYIGMCRIHIAFDRLV